MSTEHPEGGQPTGQLSPDGNWRWDGRNWVPAHQVPVAGGHPVQQGAPPQYAAQQPQQQHGAPPPYTQQQSYPQQQYAGGMPPTPTKKGLPGWAKILVTLVVLGVGLIGLLTIVGVAMGDDYASWSCEDVAEEAVRISDENDGMLVLKDVTALEITEDNRSDFTAPKEGRGVVLSCEGTGDWTELGDAPVLVVLEAGEDGEEWVRYEMAD